MSDEKPINAMYGSKMKLDLDKINNNKNDVENEPVEVEDIEIEVEDTSVEEVQEEVSIDDVEEEIVESEPAKNNSAIQNDKLLAEKDKKLANQSSELNYLTNTVIPKLKKENNELKALKKELTDALEKSTRKYFDQLDINADLSNQIGKLGADGAVNKVRADKLESELDSIKDKYESEIDELNDKLNSANVDDLKNENESLNKQINDLNTDLSDLKVENQKLSDELNTLRSEMIEIGNYKEEVDNNYKKDIENYKEEISSLKTQLKVKESSYDKLSNESKSTIADLNRQINQLEEDLSKKSKGLFDRFK